jgi:hypothetical protein
MDIQHSISERISKQAQQLSTRQGRQQLVTAALDFVTGTTLFPSQHEQHLLAQFVQGSLTIEQVIEQLEAN